MIADKIRKLIAQALEKAGFEPVEFNLEHPGELAHGDYASNIALIVGKKAGKNPKDIAELLKQKVDELIADDQEIQKAEVAGPGFLNFYLSKLFFKESVSDILDKKEKYGEGNRLEGKKVLYEYTDPNAFKQFHIGHLMSNAIGEALSRLAQWNGAEVERMTYGSDVGLPVAKAIYGMMKNKAGFPHDDDSLEDKVKFIGDAYTLGHNSYEDDPEAKEEIKNLNKKIFDLVNGIEVDQELKIYYEKGRDWSVKVFERLYAYLGSKFDFNIFESEISEEGRKLVLEYLEKGVFEKSQGAIIYKGENDGLHTRVFINSEGLPVYEAKDLGLNMRKFRMKDWDESVVITAHEQKDYYRVVLAALSHIDKKIAEKTIHLTHGMMRFAAGKMSSRAGNIVTAEDLIGDIKNEVSEKIADRDYDEATKEKVKDAVALGALKYTVLRQAPGKDIIYDPATALSFEGDSGPYLQYAITRAHSVLRKADEKGVFAAVSADDFEVTALEQMLYRFPEVVERAGESYSPQLITTYLTELAGAFNSWYGNHVIVSDDDTAPYRVALTAAFTHIMANGLSILAIPVPERM